MFRSLYSIRNYLIIIITIITIIIIIHNHESSDCVTSILLPYVQI